MHKPALLKIHADINTCGHIYRDISNNPYTSLPMFIFKGLNMLSDVFLTFDDEDIEVELTCAPAVPDGVEYETDGEPCEEVNINLELVFILKAHINTI